MTFYDLAAPVYGFWAVLTETTAHQRALAVLREHTGRELLEVAVGTGTEYARLSADPASGRCVGVDLSMAMLKRARRRIRADYGRRALLCRTDARALPFRSGSFDTILNCYMIDLLPDGDIPVVMREFQRVLRAGGRLVLVTMGQQTPIVQRLWMALFHHFPLLVGGCRPIDAGRWLRGSGWKVERQEQVSQMGFRSELLLARPPVVASD